MLLREKSKLEVSLNLVFKKSKIELSKFRRTVSMLRIRSTQHIAFSVAASSSVLEKWDV